MSAQSVKKFKSPFQLYNKSRQIVTANLNLFVLLNVFTVLGIAWQMGLDARSAKSAVTFDTVIGDSVFGPSASLPGASGTFLATVIILSIIPSLMLIILELRTAQGKKPTVDGLWREFTHVGWRLFLVEILLTLLIGLGILAFVIPGIFLLWRLILAPFVLIDKDIKVIEAIKKSWEITRGHPWPIYNVLLVSLLLSLPSLVPVIGPLIAFILLLFYSVSMPLRYVEITGKSK